MPKDEPKTLTRKRFLAELGRSGVVITRGIISQEEYNRELKGKQGIDTYNRMRKSDGTVRAALSAVKLPILAAEWRVESVSDDPQDMLAAQLVEASLFHGINFDSLLREILTMLDFGFSVFEQVFEVRQFEGKEYVLLQKLGFRKQTSIKAWTISENNEEVKGITQALVGGADAKIPWYKAVVFSFEQEGENYEGVSLLRTAYKHWYMKDVLYQIDAIAHEKQGLGIMKIKVPPTAKEDDKDTAREIAREQRANEENYIEELEGFSFDFMDMKAKTTRDIMPSIDHHDRRILLSVLAQFLSIGGADSSGSFAASNDQSDLFIMSLQAIAKEVAARLTDTVVRNIVELNGVAVTEMPQITFGRIGKESVEVFAEALHKLFTSGGITPDPELENYIRRAMHLPELSDDMLKDYDGVRALRRNPSAPTLPAASTSANEDAAALLMRASEVRDKLKGLSSDNANT